MSIVGGGPRAWTRIYLSTNQSINHGICLSVCQSVCLSIYRSISISLARLVPWISWGLHGGGAICIFVENALEWETLSEKKTGDFWEWTPTPDPIKMLESLWRISFVVLEYAFFRKKYVESIPRKSSISNDLHLCHFLLAQEIAWQPKNEFMISKYNLIKIQYQNI